MQLEPWQQVYQCRNCGDKIYSRTEGEYRECGCGNIAVDQTKFYSRMIGNIKDFKHVPAKNLNKKKTSKGRVRREPYQEGEDE